MTRIIQNNIISNPLSFTAKAGYIVDLEDDYWRLDKNTKIALGAIRKLLREETFNSYINVMKHYAQEYSAAHTRNVNERCLHFFRAIFPSAISVESIINYRSALSKNAEWYVGVIRGFFKRWHGLGYDGMPDDVIELLEGWTIKGNIKGDTIKRLDPIKGPLSDIELQGFNESTVQAFERGNISLSDMAIGLIISNTGRRPIQISHLRLKDVLLGKNKRGDEAYLINIPRAKQRATAFREQFKQFAITKELWVVLTL
jgi:integrase